MEAHPQWQSQVGHGARARDKLQPSAWRRRVLFSRSMLTPTPSSCRPDLVYLLFTHSYIESPGEAPGQRARHTYDYAFLASPSRACVSTPCPLLLLPTENSAHTRAHRLFRRRPLAPVPVQMASLAVKHQQYMSVCAVVPCGSFVRRARLHLSLPASPCSQPSVVQGGQSQPLPGILSNLRCVRAGVGLSSARCPPPLSRRSHTPRPFLGRTASGQVWQRQQPPASLAFEACVALTRPPLCSRSRRRTS